MNIGERIIKHRKQNGWSQEELAERLGVSRQSVSKWESGTSMPDINRILEMSELFAVTTDYLLKGSFGKRIEAPEIEAQGQAVSEEAEEQGQVISGKTGAFGRAGQARENAKIEQAGETAPAAFREMADGEAMRGRAGNQQEGFEASGAGKQMAAEEINRFMENTAEFGKKVALGVMLCILSPAVLIGAAGFTGKEGGEILSERAAALIGLLCLFIMVASAVMLFIRGSIMMKRYEYVKSGMFFLDAESVQVIEGVFADFAPQFSNGIAKGVALCILSPVPLIVVSLIGFSQPLVVLMVSVLLLMVASGVSLFIRLGIMKGGFLQLLKQNQYDAAFQENVKREEKLGSIYWPAVTAIYLLWSFLSNDWHITWVIWPVAGCIFAAVSNAMKNNEKKGF